MNRKRRDYPWRRNHRRLFLVVFCFAAAVATAMAVLHWQGESSLQKQMAAIRAKGEPITANELAQRYPAPAKTDRAEEHYGKAGESLKAVLSANDYRGKITKINDAPPQERFSEELHQWMESYLAEHADALRMLHEASGNPAVRYDIDWSQGFSAPVPNLLQLRGSAQLLQLEAFSAAEDGDGARTAEAIVAALAMDRPMREAPILIMQMMRQALRGMACATIRRVLPMAAFSDEQLVRLQAALAGTDVPEALTDAFIGERAMGLWGFDHPQMVVPQIRDAEQWFPGAGSLAAGLLRMTVTASGDRERYTRYMTEMVEASRRPYLEAAAAIERLERDRSSWRSPLPSFAEMVIPNLSRCISQTARNDAFMYCAQAALALERYRLANGRAPSQAAELTPAFLSAVPLDPFNNQPLHYSFNENGYAFYSVGENLKDDGGDDTSKGNLDVVFRVAYLSKQE